MRVSGCSYLMDVKRNSCRLVMIRDLPVSEHKTSSGPSGTVGQTDSLTQAQHR